MKSDDDRIERRDPRTALDMDEELVFDCCKTPKSVICHTTTSGGFKIKFNS